MLWLKREIWPAVRRLLACRGVSDGSSRGVEFEFGIFGSFPSHAPPLVLVAWPVAAECHVFGSYPRRQDMRLSDPDVGFVVRKPPRDQYQALAQYVSVWCGSVEIGVAVVLTPQERRADTLFSSRRLGLEPA